MQLTKMQGLGNDYLYHFGAVENPPELSRSLSDRHFGIGSDGLILIEPSDCADFKMRIFNADGSEAKMCGNGIRCVGKYVFDKGYTDKKQLTVETLSGIRTLELSVSFDKVSSVSVDMGQYTVSAPLTLRAAGQSVTCMPVSVGNPHAVVFVKDAESVPLAELGAAVEHDPHFPGGVNVEFVQQLSDKALRLRVWERGSGITLACGTGACAAVAAAVEAGRCNINETIAVRLDGGTLEIKAFLDRSLRMTGPAKTVCECEVSV